MKDRKIFEADARSELIVDDAIQDRGCDTDENDF
jgi:hypothetical protein